MISKVEITARLSSLPEAQRRAFAAAVATRQVVSLERVADKRFNVADRLWQGVGANKPPAGESWARRIALLPKLLPSCDGIRPCSLYVRQAMAALGYAMLCRLSCDSQDATKAAICAVNAAKLAEGHLAAVRQKAMAGEAKPSGAGLLEKRELEHQESDLSYLSMGWLDEIRWRSYANPMLTQDEAILMSAAK